jgi:hypothetical protein
LTIAEMPCSGVGCASAQPSLPASGVKPGGQGRPVRAERSEPRSGALYGRAKRSCLRPERVHVLEDPKELGSAATARTSGAAAPSHHPRKQHKRRFLLAPRCSEWVDLSSCVDQALGPLVAGRFACRRTIGRRTSRRTGCFSLPNRGFAGDSWVQGPWERRLSKVESRVGFASVALDVRSTRYAALPGRRP